MAVAVSVAVVAAVVVAVAVAENGDGHAYAYEHGDGHVNVNDLRRGESELPEHVAASRGSLYALRSTLHVPRRLSGAS